MKKIIFALAIPLLGASCVRVPPAPATQQAPYLKPLTAGQQTIYVEVAADQAAWEQGLSGRDPLRDDQGMLFDFHPPQSLTQSFWMKDMKFPLDLVWIRDGMVVGITARVPAPAPGTTDSALPLYASPEPVTMVLEVRGGWSADHGLHTGDTISLP